MKLISSKSDCLEGSVKVPKSKSHTLRAVIFASLADGKSVIKEPLVSPDAISCINACRMLGAVIDDHKDHEWVIEGTAGRLNQPKKPIDVGNSGITLRFIAGIAANLDGIVEITGDDSIKNNRQMSQVIKAINDLGGRAVSKEKQGYAPMLIKGPIRGGITEIDGSDSQAVSACLLASLLCKNPVEIHVKNPGETPWIGLNLSWFGRLGIKCAHNGFKAYYMPGCQHFKGFSISVPGDFSSAAFPMAAAIMTPGSKLELQGLDMLDSQGDKAIINILHKMGAKITTSASGIIAFSSTLKGIEIDANDFIDAIPILSVLGCYAEGKTIIKNAAVARTKESDRLSAMPKELAKMGAFIEEQHDRIIIHHSRLKGAELDSHNDHRVALSLAVAGMIAEGKTIINNSECISKTYARFPQDINKCGAEIISE